MIVKKMPILQGFPDLSSVKFLSNSIEFDCGKQPVFYDIETTGLSRNSTFLYLIGAVAKEKNDWFLYQWMAETLQEEPEILCEFFDFLKISSSTIQYNGSSFDQPYLEERYKKHNLPSPFGRLPGLDLYRELKPCKNLLKLCRMKQPDLEFFLGSTARKYCDGGTCIRLYQSYLKHPEPELAETLLGHNSEDLLGLGSIFSMLSYRCLFSGGFEPTEASLEQNQLLLRFRLPFAIPAPVSHRTENFSVVFQEEQGALMTETKEQKTRQYYRNWKDYDFIPGEDTAMPKSLSRYLDKSLKQPSRPETCYTWFSCGKSFLEDKEKQRQYLNSTLPCLLSFLPGM